MHNKVFFVTDPVDKFLTYVDRREIHFKSPSIDRPQRTLALKESQVVLLEKIGGKQSTYAF